MRHLVQSGVNTRTGGAAPRAYVASTDTPRSSLVGFTLLALVIIQLVSGVFITARIFESPEVQNLAGLLHKVLPLFFVGVWCVHIVRGFLSLSTFGIPALKTGMAVFFVAVIVLGAGYMLAASGEAGYWGAVVSAFNIVSAAVDFVFKVVWFCCTFAGVLLGVDTNALFAALVGSTTISPSVFFSFLLFVHLSGGIFLFLLVSAHMGSAHGAGTVAGSTLRGSSRAVLSSAVESRDLRFVVALSCTLLIVALGLSWLLRTGNGILLNTEIKPPARVATEVYFSGVYAGFRYMPMVSCVVLFVATTLAFWFFASRAVTKQSRTLLLAACLLSVFVFSVIGFMPVDLVEHLFINAQDACLPCWLDVVYADETPSRRLVVVSKSDVSHGVGKEMYRLLRNDPNLHIVVRRDDIEWPVTPPQTNLDPAVFVDWVLFEFYTPCYRPEVLRRWCWTGGLTAEDFMQCERTWRDLIIKNGGKLPTNIEYVNACSSRVMAQAQKRDDALTVTEFVRCQQHYVRSMLNRAATAIKD